MTVLYDGACPLCSREIAWYRRQPVGETISWVDLSRCDEAALPQGINREKALARFHIVLGDGQQISDAAAFARLWGAYPRLRPLGRLASLPGIAPVIERGYLVFLRLRPWLARRLAPRDPAHQDIP